MSEHDIDTFEEEIMFPPEDIVDTSSDPFDVFFQWFKEAETRDNLPNAAVLSTVRQDQKPNSRYVLIKEVTREKGFVFYTNLKSNKASEIFANPYVSLCFFWLLSGKQVKVIGKAHLLSDEEVVEYFKSRPRLSQLSAWASEQSSPVQSYDVLKERFLEFSKKFKDTEIPRPPWWKGFYVIPEEFDFLIYTLFRLHKRVLFVNKDGKWEKTYLCP